MENICALAFNCFIIVTIITKEDLPEPRANWGFYSLSSTCHHNKHSLEIFPHVLLYFTLRIKESHLCIWSRWLLLYKTASVSQDEAHCAMRCGTRFEVSWASHTQGGIVLPGLYSMCLGTFTAIDELAQTPCVQGGWEHQSPIQLLLPSSAVASSSSAHTWALHSSHSEHGHEEQGHASWWHKVRWQQYLSKKIACRGPGL